MGFLKKAVKEEEYDPGSSNEELYERLFPKIGRDFVYKEDLVRMLGGIMALLDPDGENPLDTQSSVEAVKKAREYRRLLKKGKDGSEIYKDLINMDDDDDS